MSRVRPRFFDQVWHKTMYASSGNKHFFTKSCHRQTYEQPPRTYQNSYFQSHFSVLKIGRIFPKQISMKNIGLKWVHPIIFVSIVFHNSHLIQKCIQNQQQLLILYTLLNQMRVVKNIRWKDDRITSL